MLFVAAADLSSTTVACSSSGSHSLLWSAGCAHYHRTGERCIFRGNRVHSTLSAIRRLWTRAIRDRLNDVQQERSVSVSE
jgi:hypothetical protein